MNIHSVMARRSVPHKQVVPPAVPVETGKRQAILDAALDLFAERGFHGTAVPLVAERAGVGAGTVYRYFDSKEALVNELFQFWKHELGRALLYEFPVGAPMQEQFHEVWTRLHRFAAVHPKAVAFLELHHHRDYLDARSRAVEDAVLLPLYQFVGSAQERGDIKPVPAEVLMAMVYGTFTALLRASSEKRLTLTPALLDAAETALWEAIRA
jgi:TetR/AcrR family transcriptional regulator, repressor of fatR-cypB operon